MICYMLIMNMPLWITVYLRNKRCLNLESWIFWTCAMWYEMIIQYTFDSIAVVIIIIVIIILTIIIIISVGLIAVME